MVAIVDADSTTSFLRGNPLLYLAGLFCVAGVAWAVWRSKTESKELREMEAELSGDRSADNALETIDH